MIKEFLKGVTEGIVRFELNRKPSHLLSSDAKKGFRLASEFNLNFEQKLGESQRKTRLRLRTGPQILKFLQATSAIFIFGLMFTKPISAQTIDLGIYPPIFQVQTITPNDLKLPFFIQNFQDTSVPLTIYLRPFVADPSENGNIVFLNDTSSLPDPFLAKRIRVFDEAVSIQKLVLSPKQKKDLTLEVSLPSNEAKGDYYFSLIFSSDTQSTNNSNSSQLSAGIASNILLSIGPVGETKGYIEEFSAPPLISQGPVPFTVRVKNTSDHFITVKGDIVIKNMFGQAIGKVELLPVNILSNTIRRIPDSAQADPNSKNYQIIKIEADKNGSPVAIWPEKFLVGPYTADLTLALSESGPLYKRSIIFFAFPLEYLLGIFVIITIICFIAIRVRQKSHEV
jgi:hypothetical protein